MMIPIELKTEYIFKIFGFPITNSFFTTLLVTAILTIMVLFFSRLKSKNNIVFKAISVLVYEILILIDSVTADRKFSHRVLPLVATFFIFIVSANLLALIPGFLGSVFVQTTFGPIQFLRSPNSDLTTTLALAIISVISIQYFSVKTMGIKNYLKKFFNFRGPLEFVVGFFEILSESIKILSFSMRLFGNVFAGEVLLLVTAFLSPFIIPLPFIILEVFVGVIQAFIFAMLTLAFVKSSTMRRVEAT